MRLILLLPFASMAAALTHPGMLHTTADFTRIKAKVNAQAEPWLTGYTKLTSNSHAQTTYAMQGPVATVIRGTGAAAGSENYSKLYNDAAAAYQLALRWMISGDTAFADKAVQILNAWAGTLVAVDGTSDKFLASGLYGYQLANAAELLRAYDGWPAASFDAFKQMMATVFYPMNVRFLDDHNSGNPWYHYRANWSEFSFAVC